MSAKSYVDIMIFSNNEIIEEETNVTKWTIINKKSGLIKEAKSTQLLKNKFESIKYTYLLTFLFVCVILERTLLGDFYISMGSSW